MTPSHYILYQIRCSGIFLPGIQSLVKLTPRERCIIFLMILPLIQNLKTLRQCFSTGVPRRTSVPLNFSRCAAKSLNVKESIHKYLYFHHFGLFFTPPYSFSKLVCSELKKVENHCLKGLKEGDSFLPFPLFLVREKKTFSSLALDDEKQLQEKINTLR